MKEKRLLLRIVAPHFVAGAVWERTRDKGWRCVKAAPILKWMQGCGMNTAHICLQQQRLAL